VGVAHNTEGVEYPLGPWRVCSGSMLCNNAKIIIAMTRTKTTEEMVNEKTKKSKSKKKYGEEKQKVYERVESLKQPQVHHEKFEARHTISKVASWTARTSSLMFLRVLANANVMSLATSQGCTPNSSRDRPCRSSARLS
jgi:hypothetical protein